MSEKLQLYQTADGSYTLVHPNQPESYHSRHGAVTESKMVFLQNSGVLQRLQCKLPTSVLEIGLGTGLNFLLTAEAARNSECKLSYKAYDFSPPPVTLARELLALNTVNCETEINHLITAMTNHTPGIQQINNYTDLEFSNEDVRNAVTVKEKYNAIYLDAFSIKQNPDLWQSRFLQKLHTALMHDGLLASYSVNRGFKDALHDAGFSWRKVRGPGGKREVIIASKAAE